MRRVYDRDAAEYHRSMSRGLTVRALAGRREKVGEEVRGRLLDIGFGSGLSLPHYPPGVDVVGLDSSLPMLWHALSEAPRGVMLVQGDAEQLPFPDRCFDSVAFNLCLCTIPDPERAIREALRVARPGARMVFLEHVRSHLWPVALVQDLINPACVLLQADHLNRRTAAIARHAGVEIERIDRWMLGIFNLIVGHAPAGRP